MFGTLRLASDSTSVEFIEHATGDDASRLGGHVFSHTACDRCRFKKLRCNGRRAGCDRCSKKSLKCTYQTDVKRPRPKTRPSSRGDDLSRQAPVEDAALSTVVAGAAVGRQTDREPATGNTSQSHAPGGANVAWNIGGVADQEDNNRMWNPVPNVNLDDLNFPDDGLSDFLDSLPEFTPEDLQTAQLAETGFRQTDVLHSAAGPAGSILDSFKVDEQLLNEIARGPTSPLAYDTESIFSRERSRTSSSVSSSLQTAITTPNPHISSELVRPGTRTDTQDCQCLKCLMNTLDETEVKVASPNANSIYILISSQRRAITMCNRVWACRSCEGKVEYIPLLGVICERIASLSEAIVAALIRAVHEQSMPGVLDQSGTSSSNTASSNTLIRVGQLELKTQEEVGAVLAAVVKLQLKHSLGFVLRIRDLAASNDRPVQAESLKKLGKKLRHLAAGMRTVTSDMESDSE